MVRNISFFLIFCFTMVSEQGSAQVVIKPSAGINFTDFSKDPNTGKYKARVGYQLGGTVALGKKVYVEPGIFWLKKSTEYISEVSNQNDVKYDISGIRIPVAIGFNLLGNEKSPISLRAFGGASAFLLTSVKDLDKDDFKFASWGLFAGAGLDITIIFAEASYEWSLTNVQKDISQINVGNSRSLFINAGVRIPL